MSETKIEQKERRKFKVTKCSEIGPMKEGSDVKKFNFDGDNGLNYESFKTSLHPFVKKAEGQDYQIDADTELRVTTSDGNRYEHWRVTQLYENDKPVIEARAETRQWKGRDEDRTDIRTAILEVGQDWRAGKFTDKDPLVEIYKLWLKVHIHGEVKDDKTKEKATKTNDKEAQWSKEEWSKNLNTTDAGKWLRTWLGERSIEWTSDLKELLLSMSAKCQGDLKVEVERRLND